MFEEQLKVMAEILRDYYRNHRDTAWLTHQYEANGITEEIRNEYELGYEFACERREDRG